ncbi:hypothetical protein Tco_0554774 [Tanacetum coccineum]
MVTKNKKVVNLVWLNPQRIMRVWCAQEEAPKEAYNYNYRPKLNVVVQEPSKFRTTTSSPQASQPSRLRTKERSIALVAENGNKP